MNLLFSKHIEDRLLE